MKLRLGIVGLGLIWENIHMPILMDMKEQFEIKAFCVHNEKKIPLGGSACQALPRIPTTVGWSRTALLTLSWSLRPLR